MKCEIIQSRQIVRQYHMLGSLVLCRMELSGIQQLKTITDLFR